jgi:5'-3' exonuclease
VKTLLIDGNNLYMIGYNGVRDLFSQNEHIGGIYHFINTIKKFLEEHNYDKVIVFWDSESNTSIRKQIYPTYKANRKNEMSEEQYDSYLYQRQRVKQYLEEVFVRQLEVPGNEADDLIGQYCKIALDENITIFSSDKDLTQLISERVQIYSPIKKEYYKLGDKISLNKVDIPHQNVLLTKVFVGDKSDNICGIEGLGEKTLVKLFPQMLTKYITITELLDNARILQQEKKPPKILEKILTGTSKNGILGEEFYNTNLKIVDLGNPLVTDEAKELVEQVYGDTIDPTDRGYKNLMKMMLEDGLFKYLPKDDNAWVNFLRPFLKLTRKEKRIINKN